MHNLHNHQLFMDLAYQAVCTVAYARGWAQVSAGQEPVEPEKAIHDVLLELMRRDWSEPQLISQQRQASLLAFVRSDQPPGSDKTRRMLEMISDILAAA